MKTKEGADHDASPEVESFNEELVSFDLDDVSVTELERRFELAVAPLIEGIVVEDGICGTLLCGTVMCGAFSCGAMRPPV